MSYRFGYKIIKENTFPPNFYIYVRNGSIIDNRQLVTPSGCTEAEVDEQIDYLKEELESLRNPLKRGLR